MSFTFHGATANELPRDVVATAAPVPEIQYFDKIGGVLLRRAFASYCMNHSLARALYTSHVQGVLLCRGTGDDNGLIAEVLRYIPLHIGAVVDIIDVCELDAFLERTPTIGSDDVQYRACDPITTTPLHILFVKNIDVAFPRRTTSSEATATDDAHAQLIGRLFRRVTMPERRHLFVFGTTPSRMQMDEAVTAPHRFDLHIWTLGAEHR